MALLLVLFFKAPYLEAFYIGCRAVIDRLLPELYNDEFIKMKNFVKHFIAEQVSQMPKKQAQRIMDVLEKDILFLSDEYAYRAYFTAAIRSDVSFTKGLENKLMFFNKYTRHPAIGLSLIHEFAHLRDLVQGNRYVDALRYTFEDHFTKDLIIKREESSARAEYKYLRGLYTKADLEEKRASFDERKYFELRKKFLPMRKKLRDNPFEIEKYSKEELEAYDEWVMMNLDMKFLRKLEKAFSLSEQEYVTKWSRLFPYRVWNSEHNRRVEATRAFIQQASSVLGNVGAAILAHSIFELDEEEDQERSTSP